MVPNYFASVGIIRTIFGPESRQLCFLRGSEDMTSLVLRAGV